MWVLKYPFVLHFCKLGNSIFKFAPPYQNMDETPIHVLVPRPAMFLNTIKQWRASSILSALRQLAQKILVHIRTLLSLLHLLFFYTHIEPKDT